MSGGIANSDAVVRVGVVGLGHVARHVHLPLLTALDQHFRITALCDSAPGYAADLARGLGIPDSGVFTDAQSTLEHGEFDAVLLLTSGSHASLAAEALKRGYAVFCEKPLAHTIEEAALVAGAGVGAGAATGERLMLGYMKQYDSNVTEAVDSLDPATVRHIDVNVLHPPESFPATDWTPVAAPPPAHRGPRAHWEYRAVLDSACHDVALIRLLAGVAELDVDFAASWGARGDEPGSLEFSGPLPHGRYSVRWHFLPDHLDYEETVRVHTETDTHYLAFGNPYFFGAKSGFERELLAFHALVTAGTAPLSGVAEGTADIRTALNVLRALGRTA
ncbi:Gfo/Idh/MocA family oxidoreductase [Catenulispora sp. NF23]|uniref:Gfo/Idh/MocA family protein n=1 Tax=Catenulispora pinistramenti TaxID=2705254 RepID=UPI001BA6E986|nr:Gfo/Idh/MocA family oxidoreductase [Catenulispora pinistramenti]MBS2534611.1 Gfo/Idh/MocA family oxidoreductase [Catenulispora pinistramenti]